MRIWKRNTPNARQWEYSRTNYYGEKPSNIYRMRVYIHDACTHIYNVYKYVYIYIYIYKHMYYVYISIYTYICIILNTKFYL